MFYGVTDLGTFVLGTIFIVLVPGPNSLYVMTIASRYGIAAGYRGAAGIFVGDLILMTLAATGVASVFQANPALFLALKYAGAAYLVWLGLKSLWAGIRNLESHASATVRAGRSAFLDGFMVQIANPKILLFFSGVLPPFLDIKRPLAPQLIMFACATIGMDLISMSSYGLGGAALSTRMNQPGFRRGFAIFVGVLLITAAVLIVSRG